MAATKSLVLHPIDPTVMSGALKRMRTADRERTKKSAERLAGLLNIRWDEALDLLLRCAWVESGQFDQATILCGRLNGEGGADE